MASILSRCVVTSKTFDVLFA